MSRGVPGACWMGCWLRDRREALGLSRRHLVRKARRAPRPLTLAIVQDLERGDRLPTLARIPALAQALCLRPWVLSELAWLAPRVEGPWRELARRESGEGLLEHAGGALLSARSVEAAASAELSLRRCAGFPRRRAISRLVLAAALGALGHGEFATGLATLSWERGEESVTLARAALVLAELAAAQGRPRTAGEWMDRVDHALVAQRSLGGSARLTIVQAEVDLLEGRAERALRGAVKLLDRGVGGFWLRARALRCLEGGSERLGRPRDVAHWRRVRCREELEFGLRIAE